MMPQRELELDGVPAGEIFRRLTDMGLPQADASILVSGWIFQNFGRTRRTFNFGQPFPAADPNCAATFARGFQHQDWVDGESVVQAGETPGELGFNARFHLIERDLSALGEDVGRAFACMAEMRRSLRTLLDEVRAEINRLNNDIFECCVRDGGGQGRIPNVAELVDGSRFLGATTLGNNPVTLWRTDRGLMMLPAVRTVQVDLGTDPRIKRTAAFARYVEENRRVRETFGQGPVSKEQFLDRFGADRTPEGLTVRELVDILPDNTRFGNLDQMIDNIAEREASALRTTGGITEAISAALGIEPETERVADARLDRVTNMPPQVRAAFLRQGVDTVGKLAQLNPRKAAEILQAEGLTQVGLGDTAAWTATARTFSRLR